MKIPRKGKLALLTSMGLVISAFFVFFAASKSKAPDHRLADTGFWQRDFALPNPSIYSQKTNRSEFLFLGQVIGVDALPSYVSNFSTNKTLANIPGDQEITPEHVHFRVLKAWRGVNTQDITVNTQHSNRTNCAGCLFTVGEAYIISANEKGVDEYLTWHLDKFYSDADKKMIESLGTPKKIFDQP